MRSMELGLCLVCPRLCVHLWQNGWGWSGGLSGLVVRHDDLFSQESERSGNWRERGGSANYEQSAIKLELGIAEV